MIIITGMPRSGTSLVCQTLDRLGITVFGSLFLAGRERVNNPKGFWEWPNTLMGDLSGLEGNIVVKVMLRAFIDHVTLDLAADRIIVCRRPVIALANAQVNTDTGASTLERTKANIVKWYGRINKEFDSGGKFESIPKMNVSLPQFRSDPATVISEIASFTSARMIDHTEAINNVDS